MADRYTGTFGSLQVFSSRERRKLRRRAEIAALIALVDVPYEAYTRHPGYVEELVAADVRADLKASGRFGNAILTWFFMFVLNQVVKWAINKWLSGHRHDKANGVSK
jgi:hypothetical protein